MVHVAYLMLLFPLAGFAVLVAAGRRMGDPLAGWVATVAVGGAFVVSCIDFAGLLTRRNVLVMFMCVELMLNAVNLTFVSFANELNDIRGQVIVFFVLSVAAAEVAVGLGIIVAIFRRRRGATADDLDLLKDPVLDEAGQ